jgi:L-ascorbate metabolism protein UlaG (beta-lactamase superfamily)
MLKIALKCSFPALVLYICFFSGTVTCIAQTAHDSLTYYGHSFVKIKTMQGMVIYIDPYNVNEYADSADIVLITHEHSDHNELFRVHQKSICKVIRAANDIKNGVYQSFTIGNIKITAVPAYNNQPRNLSWHLKGQCFGYVVEFDSIKLYHAGDTGNIPEMADLASQNITYTLLPMDSIYTMSPAEATQAATMIQAKYDIPIHTLPPPDTYSNAMVSRFTAPNKLIVRPGSTIELSSTTTGVEEIQSLPAGLKLDQNFPNPFNPTTNIGFEIKILGFVTLKVYDMLGREAASIVSGKLSPGMYLRQWNASNMPSGVYFYRLQSGNVSVTKRLIVMK